MEKVYAQTWQNLQSTDVPTLGSLGSLFSNLLASLTSLAAVALFVMLVIGGFGFLTAGGDPKKLDKAKGTLTAAFGGLVLIVVSYLILKTIEQFTGVNVTKVSIPGY